MERSMRYAERWAGALVILFLGMTLAASIGVANRAPGRLARPLAAVDGQIAGWSALRDETLDERTLSVLKASEYLARSYAKDDRQLDLFVAYYAQQRAGESMHSPKHCLPGSGWEIWRHGTAEFEMGGDAIRINNYGIENSGSRKVMLYWYHSADRVVASEYLGKLLLARDTLITGRSEGSIVSIILPDTPGAVEEGIVFARGVIPEIRRCFGR
jgi:EpsI family protein